MMSHIIRIRLDWLRISLLVVCFLPDMLRYVLSSLRPAAWGGHPNKARLLCLDFYTMPLDLYLAAMRGDFVGMK